MPSSPRWYHMWYAADSVWCSFHDVPWFWSCSLFHLFRPPFGEQSTFFFVNIVSRYIYIIYYKFIYVHHLLHTSSVYGDVSWNAGNCLQIKEENETVLVKIWRIQLECKHLAIVCYHFSHLFPEHLWNIQSAWNLKHLFINCCFNWMMNQIFI